jgi:hypothetical protein
MRPRTVFYLLVAVECFLLVMLMSPGMYRPKSLAALQVQYAQAPSLELERRIEKQQASLRISRYLLFGSVIIVGLGMVGYAKYRRL